MSVADVSVRLTNPLFYFKGYKTAGQADQRRTGSTAADIAGPD